MALIKALIPGFFLQWIVSTFLGAKGSTGGILHIQHIMISGHAIYGSWTLFLIGTGLAWAIFAMMD